MAVSRRAVLPAGEAQPPPLGAGTRFSRAAWLAAILRDRILNGAYAPGERLVETELQAEFGFSNGPTREALQRVVAEGLAERAPWQGVRVLSLTEAEIVEVFQLRCALLQYAAAMAARAGVPTVLAQAPALRAEMADSLGGIRDGAPHPVFTGRLSSWVLAAAGNKAIVEAWEQCAGKARVYVNAAIRHAGLGRGSPDRAQRVDALIGAIVARDEAGAREAARRLTEQTLKELGLVADV